MEWMDGGAWWLIFVQVNSWNGLEGIGNDSEWKIVRKTGFCIWTFERSFERSNVGNCGWLADDERSNIPPERSNVGMFRRMTWNDQEFERASQAFKRLGLRAIGLEA